jgi:hypothetical protein
MSNNFNNAISQVLLNDAKTHDPKALVEIATIALHHSRIGFAWALFNLAAKTGNALAKECLNILKNGQLPIAIRKQHCLCAIEKH